MVDVRCTFHVYSLLADLEHPADAAAVRYRPCMCLLIRPVGGDDRRGGQIPTALHVVVEKVLGSELVYSRSIVKPID